MLKGSKKIIAVGKVTSDYFYDQNREQYIRNVEWLKVADFNLKGITLKTLTDFTKYPEFLRLLEHFILEMKYKLGRNSRSFNAKIYNR